MRGTRSKYRKRAISVGLFSFRRADVCGMVRLYILLVLSVLVHGQRIGLVQVPSSLLAAEHRDETCDCMEYWDCLKNEGEPIAYCGLDDTAVCCLLPGVSKDSIHKPKCGVKGFDSGKEGEAEPSEWPWHVAIVEEPGFYYVCGGSLIDENWVLTAAHCVSSYSNNTAKKLKIRLGEHDVAGSTEVLPHEDRFVTSVIVHPAYNRSSLTSDIALLRMHEPATQRHHIDVVCLPDRFFDVSSKDSCFLTGWGKTSESGNYSFVLKEIAIPVWTDRDCEAALQKEFGKSFKLANSSMCAGATGKDACDGDGGGPLVCQQEGQWIQQGIVSYGFGCGRKGYPGVYTRVSTFEQWIKKIVLGE